MLQSLAKYFNTRNQVTCILFFTYIYDLVRAGFIESRKKQLEALEAAMDHKDNSGSDSYERGLPRLPASSVPSRRPSAVSGGFGASRRLRSGQLNRIMYMHKVNLTQKIDSIPANINYNCGFTTFTQERHDHRASFVPHLERINSRGDFTNCKFQNEHQIHSRILAGEVRKQHQDNISYDRSTHWQTSPPPISSSVSSGSHEYSRPYRIRNSFSQTAGNEQSLKNPSRGNADTFDPSDECPLQEMPWLVRRYQYLSHFLVALSFVKYTLLLIFDNELLGFKRTYSCYLPGRTAILPQLSPVFSFMVLSYHAIYRLYLCVVRKSFHLDCFIFLLYDRKTIEYKQMYELTRLRQCRDSVEASRLYANNMFFFTKVYLRDKRRQVIYRMKSNRSVEHWIKVKRFFNRFVLFAIGNIALWSIPLSIAIVMTVLSVENFGILYGSCDQIVKDYKSNWSLFDLRQLTWFLCDMIDSGWLLFDSSQALVWPFTSMVFCSQDLNLTIDKLNEITNNIASRLRFALDIANAEYFPQQIEAIKNRRLRRLFKSFRVEILIVQSEITRMLQQINQVDEFMSKISAFCIFCWICSNLMVQIVSLNNNKLIMLDAVIQFMQICGLIGLTFTFAYIAQVNTKTRRLYRAISNLIALDPNLKTKDSWMWVLEYFNKMRPSYSFRLGPFTELTLANYIKAISWLITGALIVVNLFKFKKNIYD